MSSSDDVLPIEQAGTAEEQTPSVSRAEHGGNPYWKAPLDYAAVTREAAGSVSNVPGVGNTSPGTKPFGTTGKPFSITPAPAQQQYTEKEYEGSNPP